LFLLSKEMFKVLPISSHTGTQPSTSLASAMTCCCRLSTASDQQCQLWAYGRHGPEWSRRLYCQLDSCSGYLMATGLGQWSAMLCGPEVSCCHERGALVHCPLPTFFDQRAKCTNFKLVAGWIHRRSHKFVLGWQPRRQRHPDRELRRGGRVWGSVLSSPSEPKMSFGVF